MICFKKYPMQFGDMLAMCDEELLGRVLKEGKVYIDLEKYASFYKGEVLSEADAEGRISFDEVRSANVIGKRSVDLLIKFKIITRADVRLVQDVPVVQVYNVE